MTKPMRVVRCRAQEELKAQIELLELEKKYIVDSSNIPNADRSALKIKKKSVKKKIAEAVSKLKILKDAAKRQRQCRSKKGSPEKRSRVGRPSLEETEQGLVETLLRITNTYAASDFRRQSNVLRPIQTLDQLTAELKSQGIEISRSATYLRLIPRSESSREGKLHVHATPLKLIKANNNQRKPHPDARFAFATCRMLKEMASILGSYQCCWLGIDDKVWFVVSCVHSLCFFHNENN